MPWRSAAVLLLDAEGRYRDADEAALDLLGVPSVDALRATPPSAFQPVPPDPAEQAAFRTAFIDAMFQGLIGEGALKRIDGELIRVRTAIVPEPGGGYRVLLNLVERPTTNLTPRVYKIADVLSEWRTAERQLVDVDPASEAGIRLAADVDLLKAQYQAMFHRQLRPST